MPLWLWQEVQALPWSTEIVALTCGTQNCLRRYSSVHGKLVVQHRSKTKNVGALPPLSSLNLLTIRDERPQSIRECFVLLQADQDERFRHLINDIALKMAAHFCNWAKPNEGLRTDELVAFMAAFPAIDLSWRIGKGLPGKDTTERLLNVTSLDVVRYCSKVFAERGFRTGENPITASFVLGRMDEYAACYLLDRRQT